MLLKEVDILKELFGETNYNILRVKRKEIA